VGFCPTERNSVPVIDPGPHVHERDPVFHLQNVNACRRLFKAWIKRFQGVTTKYLSHSRGWFRITDRGHYGQSMASWLSGCDGKGMLQRNISTESIK